jgi:hypothetical protein
VDFKILNWTNKAFFKEEFLLTSLGSKKLSTSESSLARVVVFQVLKFVDGNLRHAIARKLAVTTRPRHSLSD